MGAASRQGITQNIKDLLSSREIENIFENSDYIYMLNQASGDRQILAKQLGISTHQLSYVTPIRVRVKDYCSTENVILPFRGPFPERHGVVSHHDHQAAGNDWIKTLTDLYKIGAFPLLLCDVKIV